MHGPGKQQFSRVAITVLRFCQQRKAHGCFVVDCAEDVSSESGTVLLRYVLFVLGIGHPSGQHLWDKKAPHAVQPERLQCT